MQQVTQRFGEAQMQSEVRTATRYRLSLVREDGEPLDGLGDGLGTKEVSFTFSSDAYLSREYMKNLKNALSMIDSYALNAFTKKCMEEN